MAPSRNNPSLKIAIVVGEPSGDSLGAALIMAVRDQFPDIEFIGVGGPKMEKAGCTILYDMDRIGVMGLEGLFGKLFDILKIRHDLYARFKREKPLLFVGVDVPDFNLTLEKKLKAQGINCVHYVSPTVWAWRGYRIHKIRKSVSHMLTLFPFEAAFYETKGVPVTYVGHPMADEIHVSDKARARRELSLDEDGLVIALLPGSRESEVRKLGQLFVDAALQLQNDSPAVRFILPLANERVKKKFIDTVEGLDLLNIDLLDGNARFAIEASDISILASGTVALEAAILRRPHVVVYKLSSFSYWLMRKLRHVDYYSMPNHLLPKPMIPELIQDSATAENIVTEIQRLLDDPEQIKLLEESFAEIHDKLRCDASLQAKNAIAAVAGLI